jgi:hypothetical protein
VPTRMIREGILTSDSVNSLSWPGEVFYRRLQSVADDYGRFDGRLSLLRSSLYPLKVDRVAELDVGKWLTECVNADLVRLYMVSGRPYVEVKKFNQRIQSKSKYPDPPGNPGDPPELTVVHGEPPKTTALVGVEVVVEGGNARKRAARTCKTPLPDDFGISQSVQAWADRKGYSRLPEHLEAFKAKVKANGYAYADWDSAFMEAVRGDWARLATAAKQSEQGSPAASRRLA